MISDDITARGTLKSQTLTIGRNATVGGTLGVTGESTLSELRLHRKEKNRWH